MEVLNLTPVVSKTDPRVKKATTVPRTLHQAARDGNVSIMHSLLDDLRDDAQRKINFLDEDKLSPLHYAARYNFYDMVFCLVERGADVNIRGENGLTPLHFAARYKKTKTIRLRTTTKQNGVQHDTEEAKIEDKINATSPLLPAAGQEVDQSVETDAIHKSVHCDRQRKPSTHLRIWGDSKDEPTSSEFNASCNISTSIIMYLASKGASVNEEDNAGLTPLHYSAMRGNEAATKELLMCPGIYVEVRDRQMMTPLHTATIHNRFEVVGLLIEACANLRCKDSTDATPLHRASAEGNIHIVNLLLDAAYTHDGSREVSQMLTDRDTGQSLPLHLAIEHDNVDVVELLIGKGSDINALRYHFSSPLHLAAISGNEKIIMLLLENKATVNSLNASLKTPLHRAAEYNHAGAMEILLENGAKIERRNNDNFTPLLIAASKGNVEAIQCLLNRGANIMAVDKNDKTPLYWAVEENNYDALVTLMGHERGKEILDRTDRYENSPLHIAALKGHLLIVQYLLQQGAIIDHRNVEDKTPLHFAAKEGKTKTAKELLSWSKHLVNNEDEDSNTPLHLAALAGKYNIIKILLEFGANTESRNTNQWTALDCACAKGWNRSAKILLEAGSAIEPPSEIKTTPLHIAAVRGHVKVVELLMTRGAHVERTDAMGRNALELSIEEGHKTVAMSIINSSQWLKALRNHSFCSTTGARMTPLRQLILKLPDVAERVFNKCITNTNTLPSDDPNYAVMLNYELIDDTYILNKDTVKDVTYEDKAITYEEDFHLKPESVPYSHNATLIKENHPLMIMVSSKRKQLLGHPLCVSLVQFKWLQYGRYVYYINLAFYAFFLTFLTGYLLTTPHPIMELGYDLQMFVVDNYAEVEKIHEIGEKVYSNHSITNLSQFSCEEIKNHTVLANNGIFATFGKGIIIVLCSLMLVKECFQVFQLRLRYLTFENLFEWLCYISALLLVIDVDCFSAATGQRKEWQWELGAFSIFLAWLGLVMFIRKFPFLGIYVVMLTDVFITFVKVFAVFILLIIGFSLSFSTTFYNQEAMETPSKTLLRTAIMMLGEFNFDEMFEDSKIMFPAPSYIIFIAFIVLMTIITMNLLVGLAVDDIKGVQEQAELTRLAMRVDLVLNVESVLPEFLRRKFIVSKQTIKPNEWSSKYTNYLMSELEKMEVIVTGSSNAVTKHESAKTEQRHEAIISRMMQMQKLIEHSVQQLQAENQRLQSMMMTLIKDKGLQWEDEEETTDIVEITQSARN